MLYFNKFLVAKNFMDKREGEVSRFSFKIFLSHSNKNTRREPLCAVFQKISDDEKVYGYEGGAEYQDFVSKFFCVTVPKYFVGEPFNVSLVSGIEESYGSEAYVTIFLRKVFVSQSRKIS